MKNKLLLHLSLLKITGNSLNSLKDEQNCLFESLDIRYYLLCLLFRRQSSSSKSSQRLSSLQRRQERRILLEVYQCIEGILRAVEEKQGNSRKFLNFNHHHLATRKSTPKDSICFFFLISV